MFAEDEIDRRRVERDGADRAYKETLAAVHQSFPRLLRSMDAPADLAESAGAAVWFRRARRRAAGLVRGVLRRLLRSEIAKFDAFHHRLLLHLETTTDYVDKRIDLTNAILSDQFSRRWESMVAREQRYVGAVEELRTTIASVQQLGLMLKRELERGQASGMTMSPAVGAAPALAPGSLQQELGAAPPSSASDTVNAYKYVGFENQFRGSEADVRARLLQYVELFQGASDVLDLGCGRGEFLALLAEGGITAHGLDSNHEMVEACRARGLDVREGDAIAYLKSIPDASLGGLIAVQVVEHFQPSYLVHFLDTAYYKLRPGSKIVLETLNPSCWFAFFEAYIRDITHAWPLHPETLRFLVVTSGFQRVELRLLSPYPSDAKLQHAQLPPEAGAIGMTNLVDAFNENVDKANAVMFSYLDYAIVGERL